MEKTTLLFVHGWAGNSNWWKNQMDYFGDRFNVKALDLPRTGEPTAKTYAEAIKKVCDTFSGDFILIGHSMSGAYVLDPMLQKPNLKKIILVDTLKNLDEVYTYEQVDQMIFSFYRKDFKSAIENLMVNYLFSPKSPEDVKKRIVGEFLKLEPNQAINLLAPLYRMDPRDFAKDIKVPVRAIDADFTPTNVENNRKYFKDYQAAFIADCGHYPMLERPAEFNKLLEQFIVSDN